MRRPLTLALGLAAALPVAAPAAAAPQPVTSGALTWTQANVYDTGAPEKTDRTWLGYTTSSGPPFTSGTTSADAPAAGAAITPTSARGAGKTYDLTYPVAAGGTYDPDTGTGEIELAGTVRFTSSVHGFTITVSNPKLSLTPAGATLVASGVGSSGSGKSSSAGTPYDRSRPVFTLSTGTSTALAAGRSVVGMAPAIATADMVWPGGSYPVGAGPDRTPNTFGSFALEVHTGGAAPPPVAVAPTPVVQPTPPPGTFSTTTPTARRVAAPKVRCRGSRTKAGIKRTTCEVRVPAGVRRVVAKVGKARVASAAVKNGLARLVLPRKRRATTFAALDAKGRQLSRRTQTVGG